MYKPLADSTLMGMTKKEIKEIIEQLRIAEHNFKAMEKTVNQQAENFKKLLAEERKHGHWIEHPTLFGTWVCSECGMTIYNFYKADKLYIYCPKCGAKMDGDTK